MWCQAKKGFKINSKSNGQPAQSGVIYPVFLILVRSLAAPLCTIWNELNAFWLILVKRPLQQSKREEMKAWTEAYTYMFVWCSAVIHPAALRSQVRGESVSLLFVKFKVKGMILQKFLLQKSDWSPVWEFSWIRAQVASSSTWLWLWPSNKNLSFYIKRSKSSSHCSEGLTYWSTTFQMSSLN